MSRKFAFPAYPAKSHSSGQARIKVRGVVRYLGVHGSQESHREYNRLRIQFTDAPEAFTLSVVPESRRTVAAVLLAWVKMADVEYAGRRERCNFDPAVRCVNRLHGDLLVRDFGVKELAAVRQSMISGSWMNDDERDRLAKHKQPMGWCRNVVNRQVGRVRTIWRWAEREGLVPRGSWDHLRTLEPLALNNRRVRHTAKRRAATWDQLVLLLPHVHPTVAAMLEVQWYTGMRPNELVRLRAGDIDRQGPLQCWLYLLEQDKSSWRDGVCEPVVFGPRAQAVLLPLLDRPPEAYLFPPIRRRQSPHFTVASYSQAVRRACLKYGVPRFCCYALRHAARDRITRELGLDHARAVLRHRSIGTTNSYGQQVDLHLAAEAAKKTG